MRAILLALCLLSRPAGPAHAGDALRRASVTADGTLVLSDRGRQWSVPAGPVVAGPVFSGDGARVVLALVPAEGAVASLLVAGLADRSARRLEVSGRNGGLRFAETVTFVGRDRVAVAGSVNPSLMETVVLDLASGREVERIHSAPGGVAFSADGRHFAYVDGLPHFAPRESRDPVLRLDHRVVARLADLGVLPRSRPLFDRSGRTLSLLVSDAGGAVARLAWSPGGGAHLAGAWQAADSVAGLRLTAGGVRIETIGAADPPAGRAHPGGETSWCGACRGAGDLAPLLAEP